MSILAKYLDKLKVKEFSHLSESEKETYRSWEEILSGRKLTDEDVFKFLDLEQSETLSKLINPKLEVREDIFLKMKLEMLLKIKVFLNSPAVERSMLEQNINNLLK